MSKLVYHVYRGGSFHSVARSARAANRYGDEPGIAFDDVSFRLVKPVREEQAPYRSARGGSGGTQPGTTCAVDGFRSGPMVRFKFVGLRLVKAATIQTGLEERVQPSKAILDMTVRELITAMVAVMKGMKI